MKRKRFKNKKDLIKSGVRNTQILNPEEQLCRNVLRLEGIKNPSTEFIRKVIKTQKQNEVNKKYKELTEKATECLNKYEKGAEMKLFHTGDSSTSECEHEVDLCF